MNEIDFLNKQLTIEELNNFLHELMGYSACLPEYPSRIEPIEITDDEGAPVNYYHLIGNKDITIVRNALFLKEKIDEERGEWRGRYDVRQSIKQALGID
jgi:hypothetical protein